MRAFEDEAASIVERVLATEESRRIGPRTRRDASDGTGIAVDFTYDSATPPVALEVTTIQDDSFLSAASQSHKLADRLEEAADAEGLTRFMFTIDEKADMRRIFDPLVELMRNGDEITVKHYTSDDLMAWDDAGVLEQKVTQHVLLDALGIAQAIPAPNARAVTVSTSGSSFGGWAPATGLEDVVADNLEKLLVLGSTYEKHLVIGIGKYRVSQYADLTPVPILPPELDRLWLVHLWTAARGKQIWSATSSSTAWLAHTA